jgi:hypothetical protein
VSAYVPGHPESFQPFFSPPAREDARRILDRVPLHAIHRVSKNLQMANPNPISDVTARIHAMSVRSQARRVPSRAVAKV